jgi:probable addiction module antidote protein
MSDYRDDLLDDLRSDEYAAEYLSAAIRDSVGVFLLALRDVADARKGMSKLASEAQVNRENLYRMLSEGGNPRLHNLNSVLEVLRLGLNIVPLALDPASEPTTSIPVTDVEEQGHSFTPVASPRKRSGLDAVLAMSAHTQGSQFSSYGIH